MPRKTKESESNKKKNMDHKKKTVNAVADKKVSTNKTTTSKKTTTAKSKITTAKPKEETTKAPSNATKKQKSTAIVTKAKQSKTSGSKTIVKSKATGKTKKVATNSSKASTKTKNVTTKSRKAKQDIVEYYDLPYRYNQTIVQVLAQTPTNLFIYWDISDTDRKKYIKAYGENFFETTKPVLIIHNDSLNYSFEVEINDFANSWYLHVNDSKCDYRVELGRRPKVYNKENPIKDYIYISSSNKIESPNDKILFNKTQQMVYFKNVKTNSVNSKSVANISFIRNISKIYNIYDLYKEFYINENIGNLLNPSSGNF